MVLWRYLQERFPVAPYALLVGLFYASGAMFAVRLGGGAPVFWTAPVLLLVFFHLRVFDEHKDYAKDLVSHPERLLSRGVVTLGMLKAWGAAAFVGEALLACRSGKPGLLAWGAVVAFTVAMRFEFGVGSWLNRHIVTYALTHNPVVALLGVFVWATTGAAWKAEYFWFLGAISLGSLALEIGRKTRLSSEEVAGVESYSSVHGRKKAGLLVYACAALAAACTICAIHTVSPDFIHAAPSLGGVLAARAFTRDDVPVKKVELGASLALLLNFGGLIWASA